MDASYASRKSDPVRPNRDTHGGSSPGDQSPRTTPNGMQTTPRSSTRSSRASTHEKSGFFSFSFPARHSPGSKKQSEAHTGSPQITPPPPPPLALTGTQVESDSHAGSGSRRQSSSLSSSLMRRFQKSGRESASESQASSGHESPRTFGIRFGAARAKEGIQRPAPITESGDVENQAVEDSLDATQVGFESSKLFKFKRILELPNVDLEELRKLSWSGVPDEVRPMVWQLLMDYLPSNADRRTATLARKRNEYMECLNRYFGQTSTEKTEYEEVIFRQIHIDMPRTHPTVPLFQQIIIQQSLERILYVWSIRHPASGYVQGINDVVTPFFVIFLSQYVEGDVMQFDVSTLPKETLSIVEADSYWCLTKLLDNIHDNYTFAQPGIQRQVHRLKELINKIDVPLSEHLESHHIEFLQFAFRWMNCLLIRELSLKFIVRMWDTYLVEDNGFVDFHLYVCASFLRSWSLKIREQDFQGTLMLLQHIPTQNWTFNDIELLLSDAFMLMSRYHKNHA